MEDIVVKVLILKLNMISSGLSREFLHDKSYRARQSAQISARELLAVFSFPQILMASPLWKHPLQSEA